MAMVLACASMQFSTNSAIALSGLLCERAMIRIAFQSSPIRSLPLSDSSGLAVLLFAIVTRIRRVECNSGTRGLSLHQATHYTDGLNAGQGAALTLLTVRYTQDACEPDTRRAWQELLCRPQPYSTLWK